MVLSYAKSAIGKVKETLGLGSKDDFEEVNSAVDNIFEQESQINQEFANINEKFDSKAERAYERMLEPEEEEYRLEDELVEDTKVRVNGSGRRLGTSIFSETDYIEVEGDNVLEYVENLGEELDSRRSEVERSQEALEEFGSQTVGELLGAEPSETDSYAESVVKSANAGGIVEQKNSEAKAEREALEDELVRTVEQYTRKIYDEAQNLSEELGGTARSEEGEFDILRNIADSRANLINKSHGNTVVDRSSALEASGEAIGAQSQLVKQYLEKLDSYRTSMEQLFDTASDYLGPEELSSAAERVEALDQGLEGLTDVVNENNYETLQEALSDTVRKGLMDNEPDPSHYFQFDEGTPYTNTQTEEEAIM